MLGSGELKKLKHVTLSTSKEAYGTLKRLIQAEINEKSLSPKFYKLISILATQIRHKRLQHVLRRHFHKLLTILTPEERKEFLEALSREDNSLLALTLTVGFANQNKDCLGFDSILGDGENAFRKNITTKYIRECIATKEEQPVWALSQISKTLLSRVIDAEEFKSVLLPACQKAMLRSPETSIERVGITLVGLDIDLSDFASELGKMFVTGLCSQDENCRNHALVASKILSKKIQQSKSLKQLLQWYFAVLHGAEGKLTVASHKISILKAIGEMSDCGVSDEGLSKVAVWVHDKCVDVINSEVHEGTVIEYLNVMSCWCSQMDELEEVSISVLLYLTKELVNVKGPIKTSLCMLVAKLFTPPKRNLQLKGIRELVQKTIDKMSTQLFQGSNLLDSILLGITVVNYKMYVADHEHYFTDQFLEMIRSLPTNVDRKLVDSISPSLVGLIAVFVERLVEEKDGNVKPGVMKALALTLTSKSYEARAVPKRVTQRLLGGKHGFGVAKDLIKCLENHTVDVTENIRMELLRVLATSFTNSLKIEAVEELSVQLIPLSIVSRPYYWLTLVQLMNLRPEKVAEKYWDSYLYKYLDDKTEVKDRGSILEMLCLLQGDSIIKKMLQTFNKHIKNSDFKKVSRDDYFIFHTAEGQLYDTSVLEMTDADLMMNMKRESKVYSYKDQLEEIKLRKELEQKRKAAGKEPKFSSKQKEAIKLQLEKEDAIRRNVKEMDGNLQAAFLLLNSALRGNPSAFGSFIKYFMKDVINLMDSPLSAPYAVKFYTDLGSSLFGFNPTCGDVVTHVSLKMFNPKCDLMTGWESLSLKSTLPKMLKQLVDVCKENSGFTGATYSYCFPLFKEAVKSTSKYPDVIPPVLDCTLAILKARVNSDFEYSPRMLPCEEICKLLFHILGTTEPRIQQTTVTVLLELAKANNSDEFPDNDDLEKEEVPQLSVYLEGLKNHLNVARDTALRCLDFGYKNWNHYDGIVECVYRVCFDPVPEIAEIAKKIWDKRRCDTTSFNYQSFVQDVLHPCLEVRSAAAKALGEFMETNIDKMDSLIKLLIQSYVDYLVMTPPLMDDFGRILEEGIDNWEGRHGVGLAFSELSQSMTPVTADVVMTWLICDAFPDRNATVHLAMLDASLKIVQIHGKGCMEQFANLIESNLEQSGDNEQLDRVRQSCVVLMGCLARHIDPSDPRVKSIFSTLLETLSTPSEKVQEAVANCLPALVPAVSSDSAKVVKSLLSKLMGGETYGERRGAAYGLAGMVKGLGILSLKQNDIMNILAEGMQDKKNYRRREGSLMALELLCEFLGRLFEPYIVHVLPYLLQCLGDGNQYVREATENTARCVMSRLSGHGVKLVLPSLLSALNEDSWRTKCGSVDLLGRMAYCAPKQLSGCLPMIVPHIIEVLGDSHVKVQDAAAKALSIIGSVIRNPEIQSVVPVLLQALQDPAKKTSVCLQNLLKTEFVHVVDSPSLALIMPVVERAFQDRSTENRRMACQIIGNMYSLTDHSDLAPYMNNVMPGIRASLLDPVPEVRTVAAKALGSMTRGMGEKCYDDLLPWLMKTLVSESNSVDRSGAAQGLSEVIGALGIDKLQRFMPEIIKKADSDDIAPHVRDGYMMMFIYMPSVFEDDFVPYIGQIITPILKALSDENEFVRETALRAGQRIVTGYADTAITLLLPELRQGIFDENWRIRYSSVQLLGDLLYKISGVSGKMSTESASEDDNFGTENSQTMIIAKLGMERRNQILAGLYMGRSDVALMVRQAALHVWKVIVANTPKTLREILPTLFQLILGFLASHSHDKRQVAARTLGDLVRKLGEKILPEIIPILEKGLESPKAEERQGVCIGLSEIMSSTSREMVLAFVENLVPTLRRALCDPIVGVRAAAAQTFGSLHATVGSRALDEILPFMMRKLSDPKEGEYALDGLGQVLKTRSKAVMPYLIPQLIAPPPNTKALAILSSVAGEALSRHLPRIFPVLISTLKEAEGTPGFEEEFTNCEQVLISVEDEFGVRLIIEELLDCCKNVGKGNRRPGINLLAHFLAKTKVDLKSHIGILIRALVLLTTDEDPIVIKYTADAIPAVLKQVPGDQQIDYIEDVRQAIRFARSDLKNKTELPGLTSPKAVKALLSVFREAILNAPAEVKEQAGLGMGELIIVSSADAIKPAVISVTGPLIRILGDRYSPDVKVAVLDTLTLLLPKVGPNLRAFLPQLQTTFTKASNDENRSVRTKAEFALTQLVFVQAPKN